MATVLRTAQPDSLVPLQRNLSEQPASWGPEALNRSMPPFLAEEGLHGSAIFRQDARARRPSSLEFALRSQAHSECRYSPRWPCGSAGYDQPSHAQCFRINQGVVTSGCSIGMA